MKRFFLDRIKDVSGVSGIGRVAEGCMFADGSIVIRWLTKTPSIALYRNVEDLIAVHGHCNSTRITWID
jgi:hypothetical protein